MLRFRKNKTLLKLFCLYVSVSFFSSAIFPNPAYASELTLPHPTQFVPLSNSYSFPILKGMKFDPADPFKMEFIIDTQDKKTVTQEEAGSLIKYFLAGLTIPEQDIWVNMSPFEKDRMITPELAQTDLGRDLLAQDYILKQISASLTYPESESGKDFWKKTYEEVLKIAHTTKLPVNTFNKIWIVPNEAEVYENGNFALITKASLKVMLEEDYLALKNNISDIQKKKKNLKPDLIEEINTVSSRIVRETILPKINQEVNSGKNFATLRQIYHSLILGMWFKQKFQESIYRNYINKGKLKGIDLVEKDAKEKIYNLYIEAFKKGLYNYVKSEYEPGSQRKIKRQYYSGGFELWPNGSSPLTVKHTPPTGPLTRNPVVKVGAEFEPTGASSLQPGQTSSPITSDMSTNFNLLQTIPEATQALKDRDLSGKRVLVRVNLNVPVVDGKIEDTTRLDYTQPVIKFLLGKGATPIIIGHNGRWDKKKDKDDRQSLIDIANYIQTLYPGTVFHKKSITEEGLKVARDDIEPGKINILENVRFADEYELGAKRKEFAQALINLSDGIFIFDAFGDIGSEGASVEDVPLLAQEVYVGPAMVEEFNELKDVLKGIDALVFGGAKLDKIPLLKGLLQAINPEGFALIGSGPSFELSKEEKKDLMQELTNIRPPGFFIVPEDFSDETHFDIGKKTLETFLAKLDTLKEGQTVVVNGTMGYMEEESGKYTRGTEIIWSKLKELASRGIKIIVIGGDAGATSKKYGLDTEENVISFSGGGVPLKILGGETLSGLEALSKKQHQLRQQALQRAVSAKRQPRKRVVGGNWKMEIQNEAEAVGLLRKVSDKIKETGIKEIEVFITPSSVHLSIVSKALRELEQKGKIPQGLIKLGAQNVYAEDSGAFTGGISAEQLKDLGVTYVILGHSEVRRNAKQELTGESNRNVIEKVKTALVRGLIPVVCVGESERERIQGKTKEIVDTMVRESLGGISPLLTTKVILAYEPVWAIGTNKTATPQQAEEIHLFIRGILLDMFGEKVASQIRILYGGGVKPDNIDDLIAEPNIDGALVGGASLNTESFARIIGGAVTPQASSPMVSEGFASPAGTRFAHDKILKEKIVEAFKEGRAINIHVHDPDHPDIKPTRNFVLEALSKDDFIIPLAKKIAETTPSEKSKKFQDLIKKLYSTYQSDNTESQRASTLKDLKDHVIYQTRFIVLVSGENGTDPYLFNIGDITSEEHRAIVAHIGTFAYEGSQDILVGPRTIYLTLARIKGYINLGDDGIKAFQELIAHELTDLVAGKHVDESLPMLTAANLRISEMYKDEVVKVVPGTKRGVTTYDTNRVRMEKYTVVGDLGQQEVFALKGSSKTHPDVPKGSRPINVMIVKADVGSIGGHGSVPSAMLEAVADFWAKAAEEGKILDFFVTRCGDDISITVTHINGKDNPMMHKLAWDAFINATVVAKDLSLYGAGQDLLADSFSGNIKGAGPGVAEMEFIERPSEPIVILQGDKWAPGGFNEAIRWIYADPNSAFVSLKPQQANRVKFGVIDFEANDKRGRWAILDPQKMKGFEITQALKVIAGDQTRYSFIKLTVDEQDIAAVTASRLHNIAGEYTGKDDPMAAFRTQGSFPAEGIITAPFFTGNYPVLGWMMGSHKGFLLPVSLPEAKIGVYDGPPLLTAFGFNINNGRLLGFMDLMAANPAVRAIQIEVGKKTAELLGSADFFSQTRGAAPAVELAYQKGLMTTQEEVIPWQDFKEEGKGEATASSAITQGSEFNPGGIDLQGINVKAAPASIPTNIPLLDFQHLEGLTFQIIRMEFITNLNTFFGIVSEEKEEDKEKLAHLKN